MPMKSVKMKISENKQMTFCLMSRDSQDLEDTKVTTVGTLSGFQEFFLQPFIKDRPNTLTNVIPEQSIMN